MEQLLHYCSFVVLWWYRQWIIMFAPRSLIYYSRTPFWIILSSAECLSFLVIGVASFFTDPIFSFIIEIQINQSQLIFLVIIFMWCTLFNVVLFSGLSFLFGSRCDNMLFSYTIMLSENEFNILLLQPPLHNKIWIYNSG